MPGCERGISEKIASLATLAAGLFYIGADSVRQGRELFLSLMADGGVYEFEPSASRVRRRDTVAAHDLSFSDNPREQFRFEPAVPHS
jgi:hypothetical protein